MGGKAEANRSDPGSARSSVRRNGSGRERRRRNRRRILTEENASPGQSERGPADVGVPDLLHQGRLHANRQRRGQHSPRYPVVRSAHSKRALRLRKSRGNNNPDTEEGRADLRQRTRRDGAARAQDRLASHSRQESRLQVQPSRSRCVYKWSIPVRRTALRSSPEFTLMEVFAAQCNKRFIRRIIIILDENNYVELPIGFFFLVSLYKFCRFYSCFLYLRVLKCFLLFSFFDFFADICCASKLRIAETPAKDARRSGGDKRSAKRS